VVQRGGARALLLTCSTLHMPLEPTTTVCIAVVERPPHPFLDADLLEAPTIFTPPHIATLPSFKQLFRRTEDLQRPHPAPATTQISETPGVKRFTIDCPKPRDNGVLDNTNRQLRLRGLELALVPDLRRPKGFCYVVVRRNAAPPSSLERTLPAALKLSPATSPLLDDLPLQCRAGSAAPPPTSRAAVGAALRAIRSLRE
jgi:hypothetical protein